MVKTNSLEFWESSFREKQAMWGFSASDTAISTVELFKSKGFKEILIPGFGYGRNAKIFNDNGFDVTGIEISKTAIDIAKQHYGNDMTIYHGNVNQMPFDQNSYGGIFCYGLIHLLNKQDRTKLINDCYNQLKPNGYMVFVTISKNNATYGQGVEIDKDRFETSHGVNLFYYDSTTINDEFSAHGLVEVEEINQHALNFLRITCTKNA